MPNHDQVHYCCPYTVLAFQGPPVTLTDPTIRYVPLPNCCDCYHEPHPQSMHQLLSPDATILCHPTTPGSNHYLEISAGSNPPRHYSTCSTMVTPFSLLAMLQFQKMDTAALHGSLPISTLPLGMAWVLPLAPQRICIWDVPKHMASLQL